LYEAFTEQASNVHVKNFLNTDGSAYSTFGRSEGFSFGLEVKQSLSIQPEAMNISGGNSQLRVRMASGIGVHNLNIKLNGNEIYNETSIPPYELQALEFDVASNLVSSEATVELEGTASNNDKHAVGVLSLLYPRNFDFGGAAFFAFRIQGDGNKQYLEIENFDHQGQAPILYNLTTRERILAELSGGLVRIALPPGNGAQDFVLSNRVPPSVTNLQKVDFINYREQNAEYLIISNTRLFDDGQGNNRVLEYANYRSSVNGGGYNTSIIDIQQLYDQYAFGIHRHPLSIRNFVQQINGEWTDLKYIFIIGKGREYKDVRSPEESQQAQSTFFVPTYGFPGADNLLLADIGQNYPSVPFGRIAATSPDDVRIYLNKVKALEDSQRNSLQTIGDRSWMKNILHLGGGGRNERDIIKTHLADMENVIEGNRFGAEVTSVFKTSSDPVQISKSEEIFNTINSGVSMITFFGHSGVGTFDFDIDNPENYENFGKYPLMFSLGCYSGNIHTGSRGISERFVYYEDKGAIAFGATTGLGYIPPLHQVTRELYTLAGTTMYGEGMGDIFRSTLQAFNNFNSPNTRTLVQQYTLQGDPAVKLNPSPGPDYVIDVASARFEPTVVNAQQESFEILMDLVNIGRSQEDSISIEITQELPNGERIVVINTKVMSPLNRKSFAFTIDNLGQKSIGLNQFFVRIDTEDAIDELPNPNAEQNNELRKSNGELGISLFIIDDTAQPVFPLNYSIVDTAPTLKVTTIDALSKEKKYILEIDTTELFNSPLKTREEVMQGGGVIRWKPSFNYEPNR
ncbi:MAG: C25 family cysteine peptidase, partial [Bacteroidota bacterium]